jgi:hypothetical protein
MSKSKYMLLIYSKHSSKISNKEDNKEVEGNRISIKE